MKRYSSARVIAAAVFFAIAASLFGQSEGQLAEKVILFDDSVPPAFLESERDWTPVAVFDWTDSSINPASPDVSRRWRLETSYEHGRSSAPVTIQIRLRGANISPIFTHPWSEGADRLADAYSNWFEDPDSLIGTGGKGYVEARLIAPPRTPLSGKLYAISIEAWDTYDVTAAPAGKPGPDVQLAYARPLPTAHPSPASRADEDAKDPGLGIEAALNFSLDFVEACITGNLPAFYRSQSDPVRSLDNGKAMARYRLNPPRSITGIATLADYKRRFDYSIHPAGEFRELFPEWFDTGRPWTPGENAYLFMGHQDRLSGAFPEGVDYLVFLVEPDADGNWKVVARPGYR